MVDVKIKDKIIACRGGIYLTEQTYNALISYAASQELKPHDVIRAALREYAPLKNHLNNRPGLKQNAR